MASDGTAGDLDPHIFGIERPHPRLLRLYTIRAILSGPGFLILAPLLFFRYETMRFRFDAEGIHMRAGLTAQAGESETVPGMRTGAPRRRGR